MKKTVFVLWLLASVVSLGGSFVFAQAENQSLHKSGVIRFSGGKAGLSSTVSPSTPVKTHHHTRAAVLTTGVRRLVPQDYTTIQAAIDACADGDTVLISEDTYLENIRYKGKAIVVASLYLVDGDTTHIDKTIIDGSQPSNPDSGSVVYFIDGEDTTSVLCGLTIRGGTGTVYNFAEILYRCGGGVFLKSSSGWLIKNLITQNRIIAGSSFGGGLAALCVTDNTPYLILEENQFTDNFVQSVSTEGENYGESGGADLTGVSARIIGNVFKRDTVISVNFAGCGGLGLFSNPTTGLLPNAYIKDNIFRENTIIATNSDANGAGIYLFWTAEVTILENLFENNVATSTSGYSNGGGLCVYDAGSTGYGRKMIKNNRIINNRSYVSGAYAGGAGGVHLISTLATISGNEIADNSATGSYGNDGYGGGICIDNTSFRLENNIIYGNYTPGSGGGVEIWQFPQQGTEQLVVNNTIFDNNALFEGGGMAILFGTAIVVAMNNVFWANTAAFVAPEIMCAGTVYVYYNDVEGGGYTGNPGNINSDPKFEDDAFHLSDSSLCIGAGIDSIQIGDVWYRAPTSDFFGLPRPDPRGSSPDMGACENPLANSVTSNREEQSGLLSIFDLKQNYPNPFNPSTMIKFQIPKSNFVTLEIYNLLGQRVSTLVNDKMNAGMHAVEWNAAGLASGVYLYRLQAGKYTETKKLILLR
jgi:hypothetical protein